MEKIPHSPLDLFCICFLILNTLLIAGLQLKSYFYWPYWWTRKKTPQLKLIFFFTQILWKNFIVCLPTSWPSCKVVADQEWWLFVWKHRHCLKWVDVGEKPYYYKVCFSQKKTKTQLKCIVAPYWDPFPGTLLIWLFILNHSLNQSINKSTNHPFIHPSINRLINRMINQSINIITKAVSQTLN